MELLLNNRVALVVITKSLIEECNAELADTSDIVSLGLQVKGVEVSVLIKESDKGIKVSLRAKNNVDVRKIAEVFGGGGHTKASGITFKNSDLTAVKTKIIKELEKELI